MAAALQNGTSLLPATLSSSTSPREVTTIRHVRHFTVTSHAPSTLRTALQRSATLSGQPCCGLSPEWVLRPSQLSSAHAPLLLRHVGICEPLPYKSPSRARLIQPVLDSASLLLTLRPSSGPMEVHTIRPIRCVSGREKVPPHLVLDSRAIRDKADGFECTRKPFENKNGWRAQARKRCAAPVLDFRAMRDKADGIPKRCPALESDLGRFGRGRYFTPEVGFVCQPNGQGPNVIGSPSTFIPGGIPAPPHSEARQMREHQFASLPIARGQTGFERLGDRRGRSSSNGIVGSNLSGG